MGFIYFYRMENQSLKQRLYRNLMQKPLKPSSLLEGEADGHSTIILKPKIHQEQIVENRNSPKHIIPGMKNLLKSKENTQKKKEKPRDLPVEKLSKEAKTILEQNRIKSKKNLKPHEIFAFYDAFPEMIEDFFYLNRISHPYDYQIVTYSKRNAVEYMTISSQGVTLYHDKEAEFLTKQEWLADQKIYYKLQKIDFFSKYKLSKNFSIWKNRMKRHYMKSISNVLSEKLFLTSKHPRQCLKQIQLLCLTLEESTLPLQINQMKWEQLLISSQQCLTKNVMIKFKEIQKEIVKKLEFAIDEQIRNFKENNKIKIQGLKNKENKEDNKEGYIYSQEAILRKQYKRVLKLIKLADGIFVESKILLIKRWMWLILEKLKQINQGALKEDWLTIIFVGMPPEAGTHPNKILWNPSQQNFIKTFRIVLNKAVSMVANRHEKLLNNEAFEKYRNSDQQVLNKQDKYNNLRNLIEDSQFFKEMLLQIEDCMQDHYKDVLEEEKSLYKFLEIYQRHKNKPEIESIIRESSISQLNEYVVDWRNDNEQMSELPDKGCGMIKFDFSRIRKQMTTVAQESLNQLFSLLPPHLNRLCHTTEKKTKILLDSIDILPNDTNFLQFTKAVKNASDQLEQIVEKGGIIRQLINLLSENKKTNIELYKKNRTNVDTVIAQLKSKVEEANAMFNSRLSKFKKDIELIIQKTKSSFKDLTTKFEQVELEQSQNQIEGTLNKISSILPQISEIQKQANHIRNIEIELALQETNFDEAHLLYIKIKNLYELWLCKKQWKEYIIELYPIHYKSINCEALGTSWNIFNERTQKIKQSGEETQFLKILLQKLSEFENLIGLIKALQSKNLDQKSWKQISEYLAYEMDKKDQNTPEEQYPFSNPQDEKYTMEWLIQNGACFFKQKIEFIVKKSEKQSEIINLHQILRAYISNLSLEYVNKKREVVLLAENQHVFTELNDHLGSLLAIFDHEYSEQIKKQTKALAKYYEYVIEILQALRIFGANWEKYEELFDPQRHFSKQLNKEAKDFNVWETQWKKYAKMIVFESNWSKKMEDQIKGTTPSKTMLKSLTKANSSLQSIKKGVEDFLEKRRSLFPHYFYFNDKELLHILKKSDQAQYFNSEIVPMIYQHIIEIKLEENDILTHVKSKDGEFLKINKIIPSKIVSEIEEVLKSCEEIWKKSLLSTIKKVFNEFISLSENEVSRKKIMLENVTQVVLAFDHIVWVKLAEETYLSHEPLGTFQDWLKIQIGQIEDIYTLMSQQEDQTQIKKMQQYILQAVYLREKTQQFQKNKVDSLLSYEWERIPKLCDGTGSLHEKLYLKIFGSAINYGGQFIGCTGNYYISPETERSYIHLAQSIQERRVSLLANPHSQETIKQFSNLVAQPFRHFVLSRKTENRMIEKILAGACSQSIWCSISADSVDYEMMTYLATQISLIERCLIDSTALQIGKYNIPINQCTSPTFFLEAVNPLQFNTYSSQLKNNSFRTISLLKPNIKHLLKTYTSSILQQQHLSEIIIEILSHFQNLFLEDKYTEIKDSLSFQILREVSAEKLSDEAKIRKKVCGIMKRKLSKYLNADDKYLMEAFIESYNYTPEQFKTKTKKKILSIGNACTDEIYDRFYDDKIMAGEKILDQSSKLCQIIQENDLNKKIVIVGKALTGKSSILEASKQILSKKYQQEIKIHKIYYYGYQPTSVLSHNEKKKGILEKAMNCLGNAQKWIVLDGPFDENYFNNFEKLGEDFATKSNRKSKQTRFFIETDSIEKASPQIIGNHSILNIEEEQSQFSDLIKAIIWKPLYTFYQHQSRQTNRNEDKFQINYLQKVEKRVALHLETIQSLANHMNSLIGKITLKGVLKIKSVDWIYNIRACQLAYKCSKIVEGVFKMNWETIKEKQKGGMKKTIEKFALWSIVCVLYGLVKPEDADKLDKYLSQVFKLPSMDEFTKGAVYPGSGLEIYSTKSQRAQSSLPNISVKGVPTNIFTYESSVFDLNTNKNKFYEEIYLDQPLSVRVNTDQSVRFSYLSMLGEYSHTQMLITGPGGSGKRSIVDLHIKNCQDSLDSFIIRLKRHNQYYLCSEIENLFCKLLGVRESCLKPIDISKRVHICIEDVNLLPQSRSSSEFLRMMLDEKGMYDMKGQWMKFRQYTLSMILNQYQQHNIEEVSFNRFLTKSGIFRTAQVSQEKLINIFSPIIETWGSSMWTEDSPHAHVFTNRNGDNIVNSTTNIFCIIKELSQAIYCSDIQNRNQRLLMTPKIEDICFVFSGICQSQSLPQNVNPSKYYAEFWSHEILRVFGDKIKAPEHRKILVDEIKKQSLLKFKEHFNPPENLFMFTNFQYPEQQYVTRCHDIEQIYKAIQSIHESLKISIPSPIWFDQLVEEMIKMYRVIQQSYGHLAVISPYSSGNKSLVKLTCFLKQFTYHQVASEINGDSYVAPTILSQINTILFVDPLELTEECKYQIDCVMNRNLYRFDFSNENREKMKQKMFRIAEQKVTKELGVTNSNGVLGKTKNSLEISNLETIKLTTMQAKISQNLNSLICEQFAERCHFVMPMNPTDEKVTAFLHNSRSIMKHMQVQWFQFTDSTINTVSESMIEQVSDEKQNKQSYKNLLDNCTKIYKKIPSKYKSYSQFLKMLKNASTLMEDAHERYEKKKKQLQECINKRKAFMESLQLEKNKLKEYHKEIDSFMDEQDILNKECQDKEIEENKKQEHDTQLKTIKQKKDIAEQKFREARIQTNNLQELLQFYADQTNIQSQLQNLQVLKINCQFQSAIVAGALLFLNNLNEQEYLMQINGWREVIGQPSIRSIEEVLSLFENHFDKHNVRVPGWQKFSPFIQLKGIHFCENMKGVVKGSYSEEDQDYFLDSAFLGETLIVNDPDRILIDLLQAKMLGDADNRGNTQNSNLSLLDSFPSSQPSKKQENSQELEKNKEKSQQERKSFKFQALCFVDKLIQKFRSGLIIVGSSSNQKEQLSQYDLELFQKNLRQRKIELSSRVILYGKNKPNITFYRDSEYVKLKLQEKSMKIELGEQALLQKNKTQIAITKSRFLIGERNEYLLQLSASNEQYDKLLEKIKKISQQIHSYKQFLRKKQESLKEERFNPKDPFLTEWIHLLVTKNCNTELPKLFEIYQFVKKCYMELRVTNQQEYTSIEEIPEEAVKSWENIIKANLLPHLVGSLKDFVNYSVPVCRKDHLIYIRNKKGVLQEIEELLCDDALYSLNFINLYTYSNSTAITEQNLSDSYKKRLNIFLNYTQSSSIALRQAYEKFKQLNYAVSIIITDSPQILLNDQYLVSQFRLTVFDLEVKKKSVVSRLMNDVKEQYQGDGRQTLSVAVNTVEVKANFKKSSILDDPQYIGQLLRQKLTNENKKKMVQALRTAIIFCLMIYHKQPNFNALESSVSLKEISNNIKYIDKIGKTSQLLLDSLPPLAPQQAEALTYIVNKTLEDNLSLEMNKLMCEYLQKLENQSKSCSNQGTVKEWERIQNCDKLCVDQLIQALPFAFNLQEFDQPNDPLGFQLFRRAQKFNFKRWNIKKYLEDILKICQGLEYSKIWEKDSFVQILPSISLIKNINIQYQAIKKGFEVMGLMPPELGGSTYKISGVLQNSQQGQYLASIASYSYNSKQLANIPSKFVMMNTLRACKKLRVPFPKIKCLWQIFISNSLIEQPITNPELSVMFNVAIENQEKFKLPKNSSNRQKCEKIKLLMIPYDPELASNILQQNSKQANKKQKVCKKIKGEKHRETINCSPSIMQTKYSLDVCARDGVKIGECGVVVSQKYSQIEDNSIEKFEKFMSFIIEQPEIRII